LTHAEFVCADEGPVTPRRLVAIDPQNGHQRLIYDPNPQFQAIELGSVRRLKYRNRFGMECYSDLVLPPQHKAGEKHPLVVVQYISEGFLRGGIGDEFPIQLLAAKGFAVLSFERPFDPPGTAGATDELDYRRRMRKGWIDRRSVESALEEGVRAAIATGTVDPQRIGITGFSEGTAAVQWALINSRFFKVAALGVCCEDKLALPLNGGIGYDNFAEEMGYPLFKKGEEKFWAPYSLAQNAASIKAPILIQTSDDEYEAGLDVLEEFRKYGNPIDLYVFDHEPHFVWQPAHRLAMYRRAVQWFEFWFMAKLDCRPVDPDQFQRWKKMRGAPQKFQSACLGASLAS
jgi:dipeptidyl aminopeptidase/acylaminoacyl peptidase